MLAHVNLCIRNPDLNEDDYLSRSRSAFGDQIRAGKSFF
jgi:hypothetical protein